MLRCFCWTPRRVGSTVPGRQRCFWQAAVWVAVDMSAVGADMCDMPASSGVALLLAKQPVRGNQLQTFTSQKQCPPRLPSHASTTAAVSSSLRFCSLNPPCQCPHMSSAAIRSTTIMVCCFLCNAGLQGRLNLDGNVKATKWKLTWLPEIVDLVPLQLWDFGPLITKKKPEEDDDIADLVNPQSVGRPTLRPVQGAFSSQCLIRTAQGCCCFGPVPTRRHPSAC